MTRLVRRTFMLTGDTVWDQPWPDPSPSATLQNLNRFDYYRNYVLVCPWCAKPWLSSICSHPSEGTYADPWAIRPRACADHLEAFVAQRRLLNAWVISATHCPGTVLSFDDHMVAEGIDTDTWQSCILAMPEPQRKREVRLWALFDLACNPTEDLHALAL